MLYGVDGSWWQRDSDGGFISICKARSRKETMQYEESSSKFEEKVFKVF